VGERRSGGMDGEDGEDGERGFWIGEWASRIRVFGFSVDGFSWIL